MVRLTLEISHCQPLCAISVISKLILETFDVNQLLKRGRGSIIDLNGTFGAGRICEVGRGIFAFIDTTACSMRAVDNEIASLHRAQGLQIHTRETATCMWSANNAAAYEP